MWINGGREWRQRRKKGRVTFDHCISDYSFYNTKVYKPGLYTSYRSRLNFRYAEDRMVCRRMMRGQKKGKKLVGGTKEREERRKREEAIKKRRKEEKE